MSNEENEVESLFVGQPSGDGLIRIESEITQRGLKNGIIFYDDNGVTGLRFYWRQNTEESDDASDGDEL